MFPKIGAPQNGWFIMENLIKMDDLGGTPIFGNIHLESLANHNLVPLSTSSSLRVSLWSPILQGGERADSEKPGVGALVAGG